MSHYYNTRVTYVGDGTTTDFSIPFPYDHDDELNVVIAGGTTPLAFTVPSTGVVRLSTAPVAGFRFTVYRDTDNTVPSVVWNVNTSVRSTLLNIMVKQLWRSVQELKDALFEALNGTATGIVGTIGVLQGGTGMNSYVRGDILVALAPTQLGRLADVAVGKFLGSGGVGELPSWQDVPPYKLTVNTVSASGAVTIDRNNGEAQRLTLTGNVTSMAITNFGVAGEGRKLVLEVWNTGNFSVTWPASVKWTGSSAPVVTAGAGKIDTYIFHTIDGGTTILGSIIGTNYG